MSRVRGWTVPLVVVALLCVTATTALAQAAITGRIATEQGTGLDLANVFITEMNISVVTDDQGRYSISIPSERVRGQSVVLRVRRIGYIAQTRPIQISAGSQTQDFSMRQDVNRLSEIVVTGSIEEVERAKVPFAVGRLTTEDLPVPALDPVRALGGKVSGVRIAQTSGRPGSSPEILLRGPTSINASGTGRSQQPLIIVDGAIMNVGNLGELGALDIESVEVVKGAAGASLYGTRAANGVITIRTKRGATQDGVRFNLRTEYGVSDLNSIRYGMPVNHHLQLDETGRRFCVAQSSNIAACSKTTDWMTEIMRINNVASDTVRAVQAMQWSTPGGDQLLNVFQSNIWPGQYYNSLAQVATRNPTMLTALDATGRVGTVRFYVSGSYQDEQGAIRGLNGVSHQRARVNLDYDARQDLTISVSTMYDKGANDLRGGGSSNGGIFGQLLRGAPPGTDYLARDTLGRAIVRGGGAGLRGSGNGAGTFLYDMDNNWFSDRTSSRFLGSISANYFPLDWVNFEGNFAYDYRNRYDKSYAVKGYRTFGISSTLNNGQIRLGNLDQESYNGSLNATMRHQLTSDLNGKVSLRALFDEQNSYSQNAGADAFQVKDIYTATNATLNKTATSSGFTIKNVGFFAGADLDYKDRYIVGGTIRRDGSSLFGTGNRWATFGRISGVWRVSEEPFWNFRVVDDFRLRASRGTAGNTPSFAAQYETYNIAASGAVTLGQAGNSTLRPETTTEYEFGTDFTLMDRLGVEVTYAHSDTRDQILNVVTPSSLGFDNQWQNAGTLQNKTWEVGLNLPVITRRDLTWSMRGSWDRTRTYITELFTPEYVTTGGTAQGSGAFFKITADRSKNNGFPQNRYGNIWGRKFYKTCGDLPSAVQSQCGPNQAYQVNDEGWVVWVGQGNHWNQGITHNLWQTQLSAADSPWNYPLNFGHPIIDRPLRGEPGEGVGITQILGNVFPDYRFGYSNTVQYKRLSLYALLEGTMGHEIYNQGEAWGLFDFNSSNFDQAGKTVETAKPTGYHWRVGGTEGVGTGGFYDQLGVNNYSIESGSFAKLREVSLTYRVGQVGGFGDWSVGLVGRNLYTITNYSGYDPETGVAGGQSGSGLINQIDAFDFPTLRTFTFSLSTRF